MNYAVAVLLVGLIAASVFAIWPVVADAPWESASSEVSETKNGSPPGGNERNSPVSTRLDVENAVRRCFPSERPPIIERVESEFLGDNTWEVGVELRFEVEAPGLVAVFRVHDRTLSIQPLNLWADRYGCAR